MLHLSGKFELSKNSHYKIFQPKINCHFVCWSSMKDSTENKIALNDLHLIYLQNNTARFYNYSNSDEFEFKIKPVNKFGQPQWILFEAEMTQRMREDFEKIDVKIDESEVKIYIKRYQDGTLGWVPNTECE